MVKALPVVALVVIAGLVWTMRGTSKPPSIPRMRSESSQAEDRASPLPPEPAQPAQNPHGNLLVVCEACHTAQSWAQVRKPVDFDHRTTGFPLLGKHAAATCEECHQSMVFSHVATSCVDCHRDVHAGRKGLRCQECHAPDAWTDHSRTLQVHAAAGFPLRGLHAIIECARCHQGSGEAAVTQISPDCVNCHAAQYVAAVSPDHKATGMSNEPPRFFRRPGYVSPATIAGAV